MQEVKKTSYTPYRGKQINPAYPVRIYRNLNNGRISIKQGTHVVGHTDEAFLTDAHFLVYEKTRQRVLEKRVKSVHAYIEGIWMEQYNVPEEDGNGVWYNPYLTEAFRTAGSNEPCLTASKILVKSDGSMNMWN